MTLSNESLVQLSKHVFYIKYPTNIGIISAEEEKRLYLIDTANDDESVQRIIDFLKERFPGFRIAAALNTHAHADHCGGNARLMEKTGCEIWAGKGTDALLENPDIEMNIIWGGTAVKELQTRYFIARKSRASKILEEGKAERIHAGNGKFIAVEPIPLGGHYIRQLGFLVTDTDGKKTLFMGDAISGRNVIRKYWIQYLLDEAGTKETLSRLPSIDADFYVPSHGQLVNDIEGLSELNLIAVLETENLILDIIRTPKTAEEILKEVADRNGITLKAAQFVLIGSTIRSYLSALRDEGRADYEIRENRMFWKRTRQDG